MRVFNVRLAAILLGIAVVLGVGVYALNRWQVYGNASFFLDKSKSAEQRAAEAAKDKDAALEKKSKMEAVKYLSWYVGLIPKDYEAMEHLGILLADRSQEGDTIDRRTFWQAYNTLENTVRLDPDRTVARRRLVAMAMLAGRSQAERYQDAKDHLERFLLVKSPTDPELLEQLGQCDVGMGKFDQARDAFEKSIANNRAQITAYVRLAEVLRFRLSKPKEADQCMAKLVKANPKSYKAHYSRARYLANPSVHLNDEALEEASKALELAPDDADVLMLVAACNMAKKKYDKARDCLAHGIKLHPANVAMYKALSDLELRVANRDKAVAVLQEGIKATDRNPNLLWHMANLLVDANKLEESRLILGELQKKSYPKPMIDYVDARIEFVQGHWRIARDRLNDVRGSMILEPQYVEMLDFWLARCYGQLQDRDQQEQALRRVLAADPSFTPATKALADLQRQKGDIDDSLKEYYGLYKRGQLDPAGLFQMAQLLFVKTAGQKPAERNWKSMEKVLDAAEKALPNSPEVPVLRANMLVVRGQVADAEKLLLKIRDKYPKQSAPWKGLVALAEREQDWGKVEKLLAESEKAMGNGVEQRLLQAQYIVLRRGEDAAPRLRKLAENADQFSDEARVQLWSGLHGAALLVGDEKQANALAQKVAEKQPNNVLVRQFRFERAAASGDQAATEQALKELEAVAGQEDSYWLYGQARLLCLKATGDKDAGPLLEKALDYLKMASKVRKDWSRIPLVEAQIYFRQRKMDLALQSLLEAFELGERNPIAVQQAIELFFQSQRYEDAYRLLRRLESEQGSLPPGLMQAAAVCAMQMEDTNRAIEYARKAVSSDSKSFKDQVWLGQILGVFGRRAKDRGQSEGAAALLGDAEKALRRAAELEPKIPVVWKALVQFLALVGEEDKAKAAIEEAKANVPDKDLPLLLAQCYELVNNIDAAQEQYEAVLKAAPQDIAIARTVADFYRRTGKSLPAEALLQRILDGKVQAKESDVVWARRQLAMILAARGTYPNLQKAINLLEQNMSSPGVTVADPQLLARLLASDPKQGSRDRAIEMFKSLGTSATPEDRFTLAKIYLSAGNWIKASNLLRGLVASSGKEPRYLEFYIGELLKHNEISSAKTYCGRLEEVLPNSFTALSRKADVLCATNQHLQAIEVLKDFVDNVDAQPSDRGLRLRLVAGKLAQLVAQLTKPEHASIAAQGISLAESVLRTYVKENPGLELVLAVFLGQHGKVDEALGILDESLQTGKVEDFAQACSLIVESGKANKEQLLRLRTIMQSAEKKFERPAPLLQAMAELRTRQGLYSEAVDIYREILQKAPDNALALNNLAVLQALQGVKLDESLKLVNRAIEVAGPLGPMLDSRATVYIAMNNPEKAIEDMNAAIADQETPVRLFHLAQAYALAEDNAKARTALDTALKKGLTKDSLQLLELPALEKLRRLPR